MSVNQESRVRTGEELRAFRRQFEISQKEIANELQISVPHYSRVETGKSKISQRLRPKIEKYVSTKKGTSVDRFSGNDGEQIDKKIYHMLSVASVPTKQSVLKYLCEQFQR